MTIRRIAGILCWLAGVPLCLAQTPVTLPGAGMYREVYDLTPAQPALDRPFTLDTASNVTVTLIGHSSTLNVSLVDPNGASHPLGVTDSVVTGTSSFDFSKTGAGPWNYLFALVNPPSGVWRYRVSDSATLTGPRAVVFMLVTSSPVVVTLLGGGQDYPANQDIGMSLVVVDGKAPIKGSSVASISAAVTGSSGVSTPVTFADDGKGFDSTANDGIYSATFRLSQADTYTLGVTITGTSGNGGFVRAASTTFRVVTPTGSLAATAQSVPVDLNRNNLTDGLDVLINVTTTSSGGFLLFATLSASNGKSVSETSTFSVSGAGTSQQSVRFSIADLNSLGTNGPYQISTVRLEQIMPDGTTRISNARANLGQTVPIDLSRVERPAVILNGKFADTGVDTNANGLFDRLDVKVGVDVLSAGSYQWSASLFAGNRIQVGSATGSGNLPAGAATVSLSFDGASIGKAGMDGPYTVRSLAVTGNGQTSTPGTAGNTTAYRFDQFEGAPARLPSNAILNGASFVPGAVAPGQVVSIFGKNLGPVTGVGLQFASGSNNVISANLSGVAVTFNGIPAPLFYVRSDQINCQVPIELDGQTTATMTVYYQNQVVTGATVPVVPIAPSIFTIAGGRGTAAMFNQDGTVHSVSNPASPGSVIQIYMTGQGVVSPPVANGQLVPATAPFPAAAFPVTVTIGGLPAEVRFAGMAPSLVGLFQVNAVVPPGAAPGASVPLTVAIGSASSQPGVTIAVAAPGGGPLPVPKVSLSADTLSFGSVNAGQIKDLTLSLSNTGNAALTVSALNISGSGFTLVSPATPFSVQPNGSQTLTVRFAPSAESSATGTLSIVSNDPASPTSVSLSGIGVAPATSAIIVSPTSLDFGSVQIGQTKSAALTVQNGGSATLSIASLTSTNARFTVTTAGSFQVAPGGQQQVTVQFAPTASGAQSGTLTIASNDPAKPSLTVAVTGTGAAASQPTAVLLQVDGGNYNQSTGFGTTGQTGAAFVNRLTPAKYPATLQNVQIYFGNRATGLPVNASITVVYGANPSGSANFSTTFSLDAAKVNATGAFNTYTVTTPITITAGDFIVGFIVDNPTGIYPADLDVSSPSQGRSYYAAGSLNFRLLDAVGLPGNLAIRATVIE